MTAPTRMVVLAAGLGTRMRRAAQRDPGLDDRQSRVAAQGMKAMMPVGRPFLDHVLHQAADAGVTDVCLVIGPEHDPVRRYYTRQVQPRRLRFHFAVQHDRKGTAHAMLQAAAFTGTQEFLLINGDNHYPAAALAALRALPGPGVVAFDRQALIRHSNIEPERIAAFAVVQTDDRSELRRIIEKPTRAQLEALDNDAGVGMNCWRLSPAMHEAAQCIEPSPRGELELTAAVQFAVDQLGVRFGVVRSDQPVLDLSSRNDVAAVMERLAKRECDL